MSYGKPFERPELRQCDLTRLVFTEEWFGKAKTNQGRSLLGNLWLNVSARAVNGRYRESATANRRSLSYVRKGIRMDERWVDDPTTFALDILGSIGFPKTKDGEKLTLDRIDNDGDYVLGNLRWATMLQQIRNQSAPTY